MVYLGQVGRQLYRSPGTRLNILKDTIVNVTYKNIIKKEYCLSANLSDVGVVVLFNKYGHRASDSAVWSSHEFVKSFVYIEFQCPCTGVPLI